MNQDTKPKMKLWKKITIGVVSILIILLIIGSLMDKYELGIKAYNKKDYETAYKYLSKIKPDDKNYADASAKAASSKRILDSLALVENTAEKLKEQQAAESKATTDNVKAEQKTTTKEQATAITSTKIPGLKPVDVYGNLENKGFTIKKEITTDNGCWWYCEKIEGGIKYYVRIYSSDVSSVEQISCDASVTTASNVKNAKSFFQFISSIPYENSEPNKISEWLNTNYNKDKASTIISGVKFSVYTKTEFGILFVIETGK